MDQEERRRLAMIGRGEIPPAQEKPAASGHSAGKSTSAKNKKTVEKRPANRKTNKKKAAEREARRQEAVRRRVQDRYISVRQPEEEPPKTPAPGNRPKTKRASVQGDGSGHKMVSARGNRQQSVSGQGAHSKKNTAVKAAGRQEKKMHSSTGHVQANSRQAVSSHGQRSHKAARHTTSARIHRYPPDRSGVYRTVSIVLFLGMVLGLLVLALWFGFGKDEIGLGQPSGNRPDSGSAIPQTIQEGTTAGGEASVLTVAPAESPQTVASAEEALQTEAPQTEALQIEVLQIKAPQTEAPQTEAPPARPAQTETPRDVVVFMDTVQDAGPVNPRKIVIPEWITQDFIRPNSYSRCQWAMEEVKHICIHYVANPGSTAAGNREYFDNLGNPEDPYYGQRKASAHFIVGLDGEIIMCMPLYEMAYAVSDSFNPTTISIEVCHPDWEGKFTEVTTQSLVRLSAWLLQQYHLDRSALMRHYDGTHKLCPKYYVEHPDAWDALRDRIETYRVEHPNIS